MANLLIDTARLGLRLASRVVDRAEMILMEREFIRLTKGKEVTPALVTQVRDLLDRYRNLSNTINSKVIQSWINRHTSVILATPRLPPGWRILTAREGRTFGRVEVVGSLDEFLDEWSR